MKVCEMNWQTFNMEFRPCNPSTSGIVPPSKIHSDKMYVVAEMFEADLEDFVQDYYYYEDEYEDEYDDENDRRSWDESSLKWEPDEFYESHDDDENDDYLSDEYILDDEY